MHNVLVVVFSLFTCVHAALRNFTIDDAAGDEQTGTRPAYNPAANWVARSASGPACDSCQTKPDFGQTHGSSIHESQPESTVSFSFTGTAVYIYVILAGDIPDVVTGTHLSLRIDGQDQSSFDWSPADTHPTPPVYQYNHVVLKQTGLQNKAHSVTVTNQIGNIGNYLVASILLFDYAVYTAEVEESTTPSGPAANPSSRSSSETPESSTAGSPASSQTSATTSDSAAQRGDETSSASTSSPSASFQSSPQIASNDADSRDSSSHALPIGLGVGLGLLFLGVLAWMALLRRRRRNTSYAQPTIQPIQPMYESTQGLRSFGSVGGTGMNRSVASTFPQSWDTSTTSATGAPAEVVVAPPFQPNYAVSSPRRKGAMISAETEMERLRRENEELRARAQAPPQYSG
ncbi:hypothetical protein BKA62DRAFT_717955 [Auriculariales sp. MPI-PUGE-AT-0066]|nr:hypothetical protein BKA62DRAFT_717955 [Auriculariales sp. MPI-PUGE-AT-0066]